jgi:hypothetical protein
MNIFTARNAAGSQVYDVDLNERINHVISINTDKGWVECSYNPIRLHPYRDDRVDTFKMAFRTIYAIYGGGNTPCLFHCYGRLK